MLSIPHSKFRRRFYLAAHVFIALVMAPLVSLADASIPSGVSVTITPTKAKFGPTEDLTVTVSYTNVTQNDIRLLKWGTGLDGRLGPNIVDLKFEGTSLAYSGVVVKRMPPIGSDFVILSPNRTLSAEVSLDLSYDISRRGEYVVESKDRISRNTLLKSKVHSFTLSAERPVIRLKQPAAFTSCSVTQQNQITSALGAAESISRVARDALASTPTSLRNSAIRYKEWFGSYNLNRWNRVQSNFNNIYDATANRTVGFDCSCDDPGVDSDSTFAYVFPTDHYNMNVCGAFWRAPLVGTDSRAGTIVHEISHFVIVADTDDIQYGQSSARSLAISSPASAIMNADSHEYFAENTPYLTMPDSVYPDLVISSSTISDSTPSAGRTLEILGTLANQGNGASTSTQLILTITNSLGSTETVTKPVSALAAGANINYQFDFDAPDVAGDYSLEFCVAEVSDELNTANNCSALPQLVVKKGSIFAPILYLLLLGN